MKTKSKTGEIVTGYLRRFPTTPTLSLARKIYKENKEYFTNIESVRSLLRHYRGAHGKKEKECLINKEFLDQDYSLPKSHAEKRKVFNLPLSCNNVLLISDIHVPYQDNEAIKVAVEYGKKSKINCIFINGDLIDFHMISRFVHLERKPDIAYELKATRKFLKYLNHEFPKVPIYFLFGNHDLRLQTFLASKAPELLDMSEFKLEVLLDAKSCNMTVIDDTVLVKMGKLAVTHGHLLSKGFIAPVNAARGLFLKAKASSIMSHVHKVSTHSETNINGKTITTYSTGCLCELNPRYSPYANNFSHGFAHVKFQKGGNFSVKNIQVIDGIIVN